MSRFLALGLALFGLVAAPGQAVTRIVNPANPNHFQTIQDAIDAALPGDLVLVYPGVYRENLVVTTNDIEVRGVQPGSKAPITSFGPWSDQRRVLLERTLAHVQFLKTCPKVVIQTCDTPTFPGTCGGTAVNASADDFVLKNVTLEQFNSALVHNTGDRLHVDGVCLKGGLSSSTGISSSGEDAIVSFVSAFGVSPFGSPSVSLSGDRSHASHVYVEGSGPVFVSGTDSELHYSAAANGSILASATFQLSGSGVEASGLACTNTGSCVFTTGSGMTVEKVVGTKLSNISSLGILFDPGSGNRIAHVTLEDASTTGLYAIGTNGDYEDFRFRRVGGGSSSLGAAYLGGANATLRSSQLEHSLQRGVYLSGTGNTATDVSVKFSKGTGFYVVGSDPTVDASLAVGNYGAGILNLGSDSIFTNNTSVQNTVEDACNEGTVATDTGNNTPVGDFTTPCLTN